MTDQYEGRQSEVKNWDMPEIGSFHNVYVDRDFVITHEALEWNSVCPRTGLPDFGTMTIEYIPDLLCVELKSLKLYLVDFRNRGIFMENAINRILDDVREAIQPKWLRVTGEYASRGGIKTTALVEYQRDEE